MQQQFSGVVVRLHGRLNLRLWDRLTVGIGVGFMLFSLPLVIQAEYLAAVASILGGAIIAVHGLYERRRHDAMVWTLAAADGDPIEALAMYDYLYRLRFRDLLVLADWRTGRERAGLPVLVDDCDAPQQVRALWAYLRDHPREV